MRRLMTCFLGVILVLPLGGCWDRTELNDLVLITAMSFDKESDKEVRVTVQFILPKSMSGGGSAGLGGGQTGTNKNTLTRSEKGIDIADALFKLQPKLSRKQFWGQCKVIIFGEELARSGIRHHFDFLVRHPLIRERAYIYVSRGLGKDALEVFPNMEESSARVLLKQNQYKLGLMVTMEQVSQELKGDSQAFALPAIAILPPYSASEPLHTVPYIQGAAIFKNGAMISLISDKLARGILWINNELRNYTETFKVTDSGGVISLQSISTRLSLKPKIKGDQWFMTIKARSEGSIVQDSSSLNPLNAKTLARMNDAFEKSIKDRVQLTLAKVQHDMKADVFQFATLYHRKYPKQWAQSKDKWDEQFPKVKVKIELDTHILRTGVINFPGGMPKEETRDE